MTQKPSTQQIGRAGKLFVAAELNRRGASVTLYLTNTPRAAVVARTCTLSTTTACYCRQYERIGVVHRIRHGLPSLCCNRSPSSSRLSAAVISR